jgi:hypothetical protein
MVENRIHVQKEKISSEISQKVYHFPSIDHEVWRKKIRIVLDLFQHRTTSGIVFYHFCMEKYDIWRGPISCLNDPPLFSVVIREAECILFRLKLRTKVFYLSLSL